MRGPHRRTQGKIVYLEVEFGLIGELTRGLLEVLLRIVKVEVGKSMYSSS